MWQRISAWVVAAVIGTAGAAAAQTLTPSPASNIDTISLPGTLSFGTVAWADYNGDGWLDFLVVGRTVSDDPLFNPLLSRVYLNREQRFTESGDRVFEFGGLAGLVDAVWLSDAAWGDVDGDGDLDLILAGARTAEAPYDPVLRLYAAEGDRTFILRQDLIPVYGAAVAWGDLDNDGDLDLVAAGAGDGGRRTDVYVNDGGLMALAGEVDLPGVAFGDVALADYDGDGDVDVALTGVADDDAFISRLFRNDGGLRFSDTGSDLVGLGYSDVRWNDADADGDLDLLLVGARPSALVADAQARLYLNDGGTLADAGLALPGAFGGDVAWFDYSANGYPDVLITGSRNVFGGTRTVSVQPDPSAPAAGALPYGFVERSLQVTGFGARPVPGLAQGAMSWGDFDLDGDLDPVILGESDDDFATSLYLNITNANQPPTAPTGLTAAVEGRRVTLRWEPGTDDHTSSLTYNVRVGTAPGRGDVMPAMSTDVGTRQLPAAGNVGTNLQWRLDLPPGTYYWTVQSVDGTFAGSPFAGSTVLETLSFTVPF